MNWQEILMLVGAGLVPIVGLVTGFVTNRVRKLEDAISANGKETSAALVRIATLEERTGSIQNMREEIGQVHRRLDDIPRELGVLQGSMEAVQRSNGMILAALVKDPT